MDKDVAQRAHSLFVKAFELEADQRNQFVESQCAGDPKLQECVAHLLAAVDQSNAFLESAAWSGPQIPMSPRPLDAEHTIGNYRIVRVIGVGGMATVYEAIQTQPHRRVALKVPRHSWQQDDAVQRFQYETEVLGRLQHPGIAQIYEAGTFDTGGAPAPFFAMEYIPNALTIVDYAKAHGLSQRQRLDMFVEVCDAVQYGHQRGILHRDLKPPNILVTADGLIKVIDFGLARSSDPDASWVTHSSDVGQLVGTLNYMSPEQASPGTPLDVRADVYSLGVVLYQLLCKRLPHDLSGMPIPEALRIVQQDLPTRPATVDADLRGDLEAIVLKAIDKDPERRYRSVDSLAADTRRFMNFEAVEARSPTIAYQVRMFARRNRLLVTAVAAVLAAIVLGALFTARYAYKAQLAEGKAVEERDAAIWQAYVANVTAGFAAHEMGEFRRLRSIVNETPVEQRGWEWKLLLELSRSGAETIPAHESMILALCVEEQAHRMATGSIDGVIRVWDLATHELVSEGKRHVGGVRALAISDDGRFVASAGDDRKVVVADATSAEIVLTIPKARGSANSIRFDDDGALMVIDDKGAICFFDIITQSEARRLVVIPDAPTEDEQSSNVEQVRLVGLTAMKTRDELIAWGDTGKFWTINKRDGTVRLECDHKSNVQCATVSANERWIATGGIDGHISVWAASDGSLIREFFDGLTSIRDLDFTADDKMLGSACGDRLIKLWSMDQPEQDEPVVLWNGHEETVSGMHCSGDGSHVYSSSWDSTIRVWDLDDAQPITTLYGHQRFLHRCAFNPDGTMLATASLDGTVRIWDPASGEPIATLSAHDKPVYGVAFSRDGTQIAAGSSEKHVRLWNAHTGAAEGLLEGHTAAVWTVAYHPTNGQLASGGNDKIIRIWDPVTGEVLRTMSGHTKRVIQIAYSPDGDLLASSSRDGTVRLWDARNGKPLKTFHGHESDVFAVVFGLHGKKLYSGSRDQTIRVWDIDSGECDYTFDGHGQFVTSLALSPDGTRLAAGSWFRDIMVWDLKSFDLVAAIDAHDLAIRGLAFSPNGRQLVSTSMDKTARIWNITPRSQRLQERDHARLAMVEAESLLAALSEDHRTLPQIEQAIRTDRALATKSVRGYGKRCSADLKPRELSDADKVSSLRQHCM